MKDINTGGPAFPNEGFNGWGKPQEGMTLRDYFAAKAMQSYLMLEATQEVLGDELVSPKQYCALFYQWADAMLKAREQ